MSDAEFNESSISSSVSVVDEHDNDFEMRSCFPAKLMKDQATLTRSRLASVVSKWVNKNWVLRAGQFEVVSALRPSGRVFCTFPTAAGKTLIACANALLDFTCGIAGVHIICQPLQALVGQTATNLGSVYFADTCVEVVIWDKADKDVQLELGDKVVVILSSPEELDNVFSACRKERACIRALMIDEAHLRHEWPFRDYLASDKFTSFYPTAMVGIFSATMDMATIADLTRTMALHGSAVFNSTCVPALLVLEKQRLDQLVIRCCPLANLTKHILDAVKSLPPGEAIVVFAATYEALAGGLDLLFRPAIQHLFPLMYSASFDSKRRDSVVDKFRSAACRFVIATCAFGTGVDFPNIRYVFFDHAPRSWSNFVQQSGRGGRGNFSEEVFVTIAFMPGDVKFSDRRVQILGFYCPKTSSKAKMRCSVCQAERARPAVKGVKGGVELFSGKCFDFEGVACNTTRQACLRTITGFFQGLFAEVDLVDRTKDCQKCSSCAPQSRIIELKAGNRVRVNSDHNKHAGFEGIVVSLSNRVTIRNEDGIQHSLTATKMTLIGNALFPVPQEAVKNKLTKAQREQFAFLIRKELFKADLRSQSLFLNNVASDAEIAVAAKLKYHAILPRERFDELLAAAARGDDADQPFDHIAGFKAFLAHHGPGIERGLERIQKRAKKAIKERK